MNATPTSSAYDAARKRVVNRLKRLEGQIRGLQMMIESGQACEAVLTQIMAAKSALDQIGLHIIGYSIKKCLAEDTATDRETVVKNTFEAFDRYRRVTHASAPRDLRAPVTPTEVAERLSRLEAHIGRITSQLQTDADCDRLVTEVTRATAGLNEVAMTIIGHSMRDCLDSSRPRDRDELIDDAIAVLLKYSASLR